MISIYKVFYGGTFNANWNNQRKAIGREASSRNSDTVKKFIAMGLKVNMKKAPASQQQSRP